MSTWEHLAQVPAMLSGMGLSGVGFVGSDAGGYAGGPSGELFLRWMQVAALSPFFRNHVQTMTPRQEPWSFGPEVERAARDAVRLRYSLIPYLEAVFREASERGGPRCSGRSSTSFKTTPRPSRTTTPSSSARTSSWRPCCCGATPPASSTSARVPVSPQATVRFEATLPAGTPMDAPVYVATSVTGGRPDGLRMTRVDAARATAELTVEAGTAVGYKYTRGAWATVERAAGCAERPNRAVRAGDGATRDAVRAWADQCP